MERIETQRNLKLSNPDLSPEFRIMHLSPHGFQKVNLKLIRDKFSQLGYEFKERVE